MLKIANCVLLALVTMAMAYEYAVPVVASVLNKENYKEIFQLCEKKLSKDGIIIIDNIFNQGDALNVKPLTKKGAGVKRLLEYLKKKKMIKCILPFYDGVMMVKKN